jgi:hypothetical protein
MFAKIAALAALSAAIVMGGTEAKKKGPTITKHVYFDVDIGESPGQLCRLPAASSPRSAARACNAEPCTGTQGHAPARRRLTARPFVLVLRRRRGGRTHHHGPLR